MLICKKCNLRHLSIDKTSIVLGTPVSVISNNTRRLAIPLVGYLEIKCSWCHLMDSITTPEFYVYVSDLTSNKSAVIKRKQAIIQKSLVDILQNSCSNSTIAEIRQDLLSSDFDDRTSLSIENAGDFVDDDLSIKVNVKKDLKEILSGNDIFSYSHI